MRLLPPVFSRPPRRIVAVVTTSVTFAMFGGALGGVTVRAQEFQFRQAASYDPAVPTPESLLGHEVGTAWTEHRDLLRVVDAIAAASDRIEVERYGRTPEGRDLVLAYVGTPENLERREARFESVRRLADPRRFESDAQVRALIEDLPAVVWLSYNVHGNEPSPSETAMEVLYHFAAGLDPSIDPLLAELLIVIDPCANPDGRDRYVHWFDSVVGAEPDPHPAAREHHEPAPGGRVNHYYFDLNRDWAFVSQPETRARLPRFLEARPQVHVDFHEMFPESHYFFFPSSLPRNENFPPSTHRWGERFGRGNAAAFDRFGWPYYTGEVFDLFYPGYGDTFPSLLGAIGMTYEQGGHSAGGLAYRRRDGSLLTLFDRAAHHFVASLATLRTAAEGRVELLRDFHEFHKSGMDLGRRGAVREIALVPSGDAEPLRALVQHLLDVGIEVDQLETAHVARGVRSYSGSRFDERVLPEGTCLVPLGQPDQRLAMALLEPTASAEEAAFYDISAWSLPLAYGVEALLLEGEAHGDRRRLRNAPEPTLADELAPLGDGIGYLLAYDQGGAAVCLLEALHAGLAAEFALEPFATAERRYPAGSVLFPRSANPDSQRRMLDHLRRRHRVHIAPVASYFTESGIDLGSDRMVTLKPPRIALLAAATASFGEIHYLLENEIELPFTSLDAARARRADLSEFNLLIVPEGVEDLDSLQDVFRDFGRRGKTIVALGSASRAFTRESGGLTGVTVRAEAEASESEEEEPRWEKSSDRARRRQLESLPGSIFAAELDPDHPLCFGLPPSIPVLIQRTGGFQLEGGGTKVARIAARDPLSGYVGEAAKDDLVGDFWLVESSLERGRVLLFSERPGFRLGFRGELRVLLNALALYSR